MYKKVLALLFIVQVAVAQEAPHRGKDKNPVLHQVSNKDIVQSIYPDAAKVDKVNDFWFKIVDAKDKTLGFAMTSSSFCQDIKGYNDVTPVMVITDKKWMIKKTAILSNWETPRFVTKLENLGFFNLWVGKKLKEASKVQVDAHTGATFTATAVAKNVDFLLKNAVKVLPK
ncbi:FMN-binding protein [Parabacteroides sp. FAFU027]|uniref:FMN-binding protein n=1 Tax=Parabacteroides sp. FAFU027 TaxID=2922715 RepID=UPI001FAFBC18|nr:FMN-binding protein [Parabacteroides sp. FAFU027]